MKIKKSGWDSAQYVFVCFATLGMAYALRVIISQAIRMALKEKEQEA